MSIAIEDVDDETRALTLPSGERIELRLEFDGVRVVTSHGVEVGRFIFDSYSDPMDRTIWRLTNMFLDGEGGRFQHQGIGTLAVKYFLWSVSADAFEITENDGLRREDGSHLTGTGVAFMAHLGRLKENGKLFD